MLKKAIDKLNGQRSLADILAPVELKVQELHAFASTSRSKAIEMRKQAEQLALDASMLEVEAAAATNIAEKMQEFCA